MLKIIVFDTNTIFLYKDAHVICIAYTDKPVLQCETRRAASEVHPQGHYIGGADEQLHCQIVRNVSAGNGFIATVDLNLANIKQTTVINRHWIYSNWCIFIRRNITQTTVISSQWIYNMKPTTVMVWRF